MAILALTMFSISSFAEDFRALDLGSSCDGLLLKEENIGGVHNPKYNIDNEYAFTATYMGRVSSVIYKCTDKNFLRQGVQLVKFSRQSDAITFFNDMKIYIKGIWRAYS